MTALEHLNAVAASRAAYVPENLVNAVTEAARALGLAIRCGAYDPENNARVLYLDSTLLSRPGGLACVRLARREQSKTKRTNALCCSTYP